MAAAPPERIYTPQVSAGGSARMAGSTPEAFGAGVGAQMERLGGTLEGAQLAAYRLDLERQKASEASDVGARLAQFSADIKPQILQLQDEAAPDGTGHPEKVAQTVDQGLNEILGSAKNEDVRTHFTDVAATMRASLVGDATAFAHLKRAEFQHDNMAQLGSSISTAEETTPSPELDFGNSLALIRTTVDAQNGLDSNVRGDLTRDLSRQAVVGHYGGLIAHDPHAALAMLDAGVYGQYFQHGDVDALRSKAETQIHKGEVEARAQQAVIERQQKEEEATYRARAEQGVQVDPGHGEALAARAEARGDTSTAVALRAAATGAKAASIYGGPNVLPSQITGRLAQIEGTKDWQANDALAVEHKALIGLRDKRRSDEPNIPVPNLNDPHDVARFEAAVNADAQTRGVLPQYVFGDLKRLFQPEMQQGDAGQAQVLDAIGHFSTRAAFVAARQLAPQDNVFQMAATLHGYSRELALKGRDALRAEQGKDKVVTAEEMNAPLSAIAGAMTGADPDFQKAAQDTALAISAELHRRLGKTRYDRDLGEEAARLALGGQMRGAVKTGGLGSVNGQPIVLPDDMTQDEFDKRYYRLAGPSKAYGSGRPLAFDELRRSYRLIPHGDGDYQWQDAYGRVVTDQHGAPVTLHIRNVNPPPVVHPKFDKPNTTYQLEGM